MSVLLFFVDGVGIGERDPQKNPLARFPSAFLPAFTNELPGTIVFDGNIVATDVTMGVEGLPQSATGQTALLTGKNAAKVLGRHHPGYPTFSLRKLLMEQSIFLKIERLGKVGTFANAFTPTYFERPDRRISASTWSLKASQFPFRWLDPDLWNNRAVSHDLTNEFLNKWGYKAPSRTPEDAARIIADITASVDFCLFEYFLTDAIGHGQDFDWAAAELDKLSRSLTVLLQSLPLDQHLVLLTSDHGNFEDLSTPLHTTNPVPTTVWGRNAETVTGKIRNIEDICDVILDYLGNTET